MKDNPKHTSFEQYEHMKKSGVSAPQKNDEVLETDDLKELMAHLNDFVGVKGSMMPYTKSVIIYVPKDSLRDICVVDTPGINDPVRSREERTEEYLTSCDVVFIVSPAGQFLTDTDLILMDRITYKERIPELYLIASQMDTQIYGSVKEDTNSDLNAARKKLYSDLSSRSKDMFSLLAKRHPEVGKQFDQLKNGGEERFMLISAMCHAICLRYDDRGSWDEEMDLIWKSLCESYPDYFDSDTSAKTNLSLLGGIEKAKEKIRSVRDEKDRIIARKQADFINVQADKIKAFAKELILEVKDKIELIRKTDIAAIEKQKKDLEKIFSDASEAVDDSFDQCVEDFIYDVRNQINKKGKESFFETKDENAKAEQSVTKIGTRYKHEFLGIEFGTEYYSKEVRTLRTGVVKSNLNSLITRLNDLLNYSTKEEKDKWKKTVPGVVTQALRSALNDIELIDFSNLRKATKFLVNKMELPDLNLVLAPFRSSYNATIEGDAIEFFLDEVLRYTDHLRNVFYKTRDLFIKAIKPSVEHEKLSKMIFTELDNQLSDLENKIQNQEFTVNRLKRCLSELENLNL
jgi:hypothetical protein